MHTIHLRESRVERSAETVVFCYLESLKLWEKRPDSSDFEPKDRTWRNPCVIGLRRAPSHGGPKSSVETYRTNVHNSQKQVFLKMKIISIDYGEDGEGLSGALQKDFCMASRL